MPILAMKPETQPVAITALFLGLIYFRTTEDCILKYTTRCMELLILSKFIYASAVQESSGSLFWSKFPGCFHLCQ